LARFFLGEWVSLLPTTASVFYVAVPLASPDTADELSPPVCQYDLWFALVLAPIELRLAVLASVLIFDSDRHAAFCFLAVVTTLLCFPDSLKR